MNQERHFRHTHLQPAARELEDRFASRFAVSSAVLFEDVCSAVGFVALLMQFGYPVARAELMDGLALENPQTLMNPGKILLP